MGRRPGRAIADGVGAGVLMLVIAMMLGCGGDTVAPPSWRATHPDTAALTFVENGQAGLCALSSQYGDQVPAVIRLNGSSYAQVGTSQAVPNPARGTEIDHSGDWTIYNLDSSHLLLAGPHDAFSYTQKSC